MLYKGDTLIGGCFRKYYINVERCSRREIY